jgi:integrase
MMGKRTRIGLRDVRALGPGEIVWDTGVIGFGARRQRDSVAYILKYRTADGRQRWHTIGRHGAPWTPEMAREKAREVLGDVARGTDPATEKQTKRHAITMAELCQRYLADAEAGRVLIRSGRPKKPGTLAGDRGRIDGHILPLLGRLPVAAVTKPDVEKFMHAVAAGETQRRAKTKPRGVSRVAGGRGAATRTVGLLGAIFSYACDHRMCPDNPVRGLRKYADNKRERRLSDDEYALLGAALRRAEGAIWPQALACARFLCFTGWRSGEALALRWRDIDLARRTATLPDTKSGRSMRPLSHAACDILRALGRAGDDALVFPATRGKGPMVGFKKMLRRLVVHAGMPIDVSAHVLRHSFSSLASDMGYSEPTIASMIGHKGRSMTSRYVHSADAMLLEAADTVARRTAELMGDMAPTGEVAPLRAIG